MTDIAPSPFHIPYDAWGEPPTAPTTDQVRRAVRDMITRHPNHSPAQIALNLRRDEHIEVSTAEICGVKAGM